MEPRREVPSKVPAEAWESHREEIKRLYRQEHKTIKQIEQIMHERHDFSASTRMYQAQIHRWDLDKKLKAPEVAYALHLIEARRRMGKETQIRIRGVVVSEGKLKRYVQRSRIVPEESASTPSAVVASTPPCEEGPPSSMASSAVTSVSNTPESSAVFPGDGSQTTGRSDSGLPLNRKRPLSSPVGDGPGSRKTVPDRVSPATAYLSPLVVTFPTSAPSLPDTLLPQPTSSRTSVLPHIDKYYQTFFESQLWEPWAQGVLDLDDQQGSQFPNIESTQYLDLCLGLCRPADPAHIVFNVNKAGQLFRLGKFALGGRLLDQVHGQIRTLLLEQLPSLLACLLSVVCLLDSFRAGMYQSTGRPNPLTLFLEFVSDMAESELGSGHPIAELFFSLVGMNGGHYCEAERALGRIVQTFGSKAGFLHPYHCRLAYIHAWVLIWRHEFDRARCLLEEFLKNIESHADRDDLHSRASRYLLAQVYLALQQPSKAALCFHKIIHGAIKGLGEDRAHLVTFEAWRMLAVIAHVDNRLDERDRFEQQALESGQMLYGPQHPRVMQLQREVSGLEPRTARFISAFPAFEEGQLLKRSPAGSGDLPSSVV